MNSSATFTFSHANIGTPTQGEKTLTATNIIWNLKEIYKMISDGNDIAAADSLTFLINRLEGDGETKDYAKHITENSHIVILRRGESDKWKHIVIDNDNCICGGKLNFELQFKGVDQIQVKCEKCGFIGYRTDKDLS